MKPWIWLRIAAGVVGHNLETLSTKPAHGPQEQAVFDAMRGFQFNIMGSTRSTWDFYRGYQFSTTVTFVLIVALLWQLSDMSRRAPREAGLRVLTLLIAQLFNVVIGWEFFFAGPGVMGRCDRAASRRGRGGSQSREAARHRNASTSQRIEAEKH